MKQLSRKICGFSAILLLTALFLCFIPTDVVKAYTIVEGQSVYDDAGLLSVDEIDKLSTFINQVSANWDIDIFILTTNSSHGMSNDDYMDRFKEEACNNQKLFSNDCVLIQINMGTRDVDISGYGLCKRQISSSRASSIIDDITPDLSAGNYYKAFTTYIIDCDNYMGKDVFYFQVWFQLLIACGLGGIIVLIMAANRGTPITTNANTYLDQAHSRLRFHHDNYIRTVVTKTRKPQNNGGGGGHGGGGGSHSHASGKF